MKIILNFQGKIEYVQIIIWQLNNVINCLYNLSLSNSAFVLKVMLYYVNNRNKKAPNAIIKEWIRMNKMKRYLYITERGKWTK